MSSHTRRPLSRVSFSVSLCVALLVAVFSGPSLTGQTGAVVAPTLKTEKTFAPQPAAYATPTPWPVATKCATSRWPAEGNANDSNGLHQGVLMNGATFGPGSTGQSFNLDGNQAYVEAAINTLAMNQPGSFTWEACVYPLSLATNPVVFSKEAAVNNRAGLQINANGSLCSYMNSSQCALPMSAAGVIAPNQFTRLTLIYNGSSQKLFTYVNGSLVSNPTVGVPYNHSVVPGPFYIGWSKYGGGNTHFPGFIDEVTFSSCVVPPTTKPCACGPVPSPTPTPIP